MSYSMRRAFGTEPMSCLPGLKSEYVAATNSWRCVFDPSQVGSAASKLPCFGRPNEYVNASTQSCKCNSGYVRDIDTLECVSQEGMVVEPEVVEPVKASSSVPTWALVLAGSAVGILVLGSMLGD